MSESTESTAPVEVTEVDSGVTATGGEEAASSPEIVGKPETPEEKAKYQERINKLTERERLASDRAYRAEVRAQEIERILAEREAAPAQKETVAPSDDRPTLESCGWDEDKYAEALDVYYDKKFEAKAESVLEKKERLARQEQSGREHERREADFIKSKADYAEKVYRHPRNGGPIVTDEMAQVIRDSDVGPEVAYYLAENVAKSAEIARLPPHLQAREIGRIEERLAIAKTAPPPVSKAPPPTSRVDAGEATTTVRVDSAESDTLSDAEWNRRRNAQEQARLRKARGG